MRLFKKLFAIFGLVLFFLLNNSPCYALNQLILTTSPQTSKSSYNSLRNSANTFQPFSQFPIICIKPKTNIGFKKNTVCLAEKRISVDQFKDKSIIDKLNQATGHFYDLVLLSDDSLPQPAKSRLKELIQSIKSQSRQILDDMILNANNISSDCKKSIIEDYKELKKVDLDNPLAIEKSTSAIIQRLSKKSVLGNFTNGVDSFQNNLLKDDIVIINACLKEKGFSEKDDVFFSEDYLVEQRTQKGLGFLVDKNDPQINDPEYPYRRKKLSSESIPGKVIQGSRNKKFIPDSIHKTKNIIDNVQYERSKKNPLPTISKTIKKLDQLRMNYSFNSSKLKFKFSRRFRVAKLQYYKSHKKNL